EALSCRRKKFERMRAPSCDSIRAAPVDSGGGDQEGGSAAEYGSTRISNRTPGGNLTGVKRWVPEPTTRTRALFTPPNRSRRNAPRSPCHGRASVLNVNSTGPTTLLVGPRPVDWISVMYAGSSREVVPLGAVGAETANAHPPGSGMAGAP